MEEPITPSRPKRTWKFYLILFAAFLSAIGLAWTFRPLNASEKQLLGLWKAREFQDDGRVGPHKPIYVFNGDRTVRQGFEMELSEPKKIIRGGGLTGTWKASGGALKLKYQYRPNYDWNEPMERRFEILFGDPPAEIKTFHFEDADVISLDGVVFEREKR